LQFPVLFSIKVKGGEVYIKIKYVEKIYAFINDDMDACYRGKKMFQWHFLNLSDAWEGLRYTAHNERDNSWSSSRLHDKHAVMVPLKDSVTIVWATIITSGYSRLIMALCAKWPIFNWKLFTFSHTNGNVMQQKNTGIYINKKIEKLYNIQGCVMYKNTAFE
jgi:hypothetical protein